MVVVTFNMPPQQYDTVCEATAQYGYSSLEQFLIAAAWNQIALHEADSDPAPKLDGASGPASSTSARSVTRASAPSVKSADWQPFVARVEPALLSAARPVQPFSGPGALLWGQTNRVLPVSVGIRVLANQLAKSGEEVVKLEDWHQLATRVAKALRVQLEQWDDAAGRKRSERWATAFPADDPASANRYMGQFLGWPRRNGKLAEGGAVWLGFVAFDEAQDAVALTEAGQSWAALDNPIFDGEAPATTFSDEEATFFVDHLRRNRRNEFGLLRDVAGLVKQGKSRTEIDAELEVLYPDWAKHIPTMRGGAMGRISDLGLLTRERHGLSVTYHLTPLAEIVGLAEDVPEKTR